MCGNTSAVNIYIASAKTDTITSNNSAQLSFRFFFNGETKFENITLHGWVSGSGIYANGFSHTSGEDITITPNTVDDTIFVVGSKILTIILPIVQPKGRDSNITVLSGNYEHYAFVASPWQVFTLLVGTLKIRHYINTSITSTSDQNIHIGEKIAFIRDVYVDGLGCRSLLESLT